MQSKKKICSSCNTEQYIWKRHLGEPFCKHCWSCHKSNDTSQKPKNPIPKVSSKRKKQDQEYLKLRKVFLTEHTLCEVKVAGCMMHATDVHHTYSGSDRAVYYLIQSTWLASCRNCHNWIHSHPEQARTMKWLK
jgi:cytochrome c553